MTSPEANSGVALIVGASRGLGLGLAREYLGRGWRVIGTVRDRAARTGLHALAEEGGPLEIESVDIAVPETVAALRRRLEGRSLDLLFVNAGIGNGPAETVRDTTTEEFVRLMLTNALGPMRIVEDYALLVRPGGTIAVMSSMLGSVSLNDRATWEVYRASKAALNMMMRSYVVRQRGPHTLLCVAPGWVRTDMTGPEAALDVGTSVRGIADVIARRAGTPGLAYVDYRNTVIPW